MAFLYAFNIALFNEDLRITQPSVKVLKLLKSLYIVLGLHRHYIFHIRFKVDINDDITLFLNFS